MNHTVLARKWRPTTFDQLIGQDHVRKALSHALDQGRLHHAYLFTGTRGVGKTTIARIVARCLNCESGVSSTPCGTCHACHAIGEGRFVDLIEVDAASHGGVNDVRDLFENVAYAPSQGRYKIYLIDEVHMLSKEAFNALLKTLEEPPEHVIFLFATTDPHKLLPTVLSRCLQFNLKNMVPAQIAEHLEHIRQSVHIILSHPVMEGMRDAMPLQMTEGGREAAFESVSYHAAIQNGSAKSGGNFFWQDPMSGPLASHVPMKRKNVSHLAQTRYAEPTHCNDIHIAMPKGGDPLAMRGTLRRLSPAEPARAMVLAMRRDVESDGEAKILAWRKICLSTTMIFVEVEIAEAYHFAHIQLRENPGIDFELVRHTALQRVLDLSQYHSRVWQEKATRLTPKAGR